MALPESSFTVPEIVRVVATSMMKARLVGTLAPEDGTEICFSGAGGMPDLNTPQRYTPGITFKVNAPEVLVIPPVPNPAEIPVELSLGRQNTPALLIPVLLESTTVPVMVLLVAVKVKFLPVALAPEIATVSGEGGIKVKVGGGGGGAPGSRKVSGIAGPTPTL